MNDFIDLQRLILIVLKKWWLLVSVTVLAAFLGFTVSKTQKPVYEATTTVLVGEILQSVNLDRQDILTSELVAQTYSDLTRRQPVLQAVVDELGLNQTWQQLRKKVSVELVSGTQLIQISVEANSPETAQTIADEVAQQMILFNPIRSDTQESIAAKSFVNQQIESLQVRIQNGQNKLASIEREIVKAETEERVGDLQAQLVALENQISNWENTYIQLLGFIQSDQSPNTITIIEPAQANPNPIRPQVEIIVIVAGILGSFMAIGLIFVIEYFDDTYKTADEIRLDYGLPVLVSISDMGKLAESSKGLYVKQFPQSPIAESFRLLRANLELIENDPPLKTVLITSCDKGAGKSVISTNLAMIMAQNDQETILLDTDLRNSSVHKLMGLPNDFGLSDILLNKIDISESMRFYDSGMNGVITGGTPPPNPAELIGSGRMDRVLRKLRDLSDVVIIDSPPLFMSETLILSRKVDGVLLVIRLGQTRKKHIKAMLDQLSRSSAHVVGVIVNGVASRDLKYYSDYQYAYDSDHRETDRSPAARIRGFSLSGLLGSIRSAVANNRNDISTRPSRRRSSRISNPKTYLQDALFESSKQKVQEDKEYLHELSRRIRDQSTSSPRERNDYLDEEEFNSDFLDSLDEMLNSYQPESEAIKEREPDEKLTREKENQKPEPSPPDERKKTTTVRSSLSCPNEDCLDFEKPQSETQTNLIKSGKSKKGAQRYQCKTCNKSFTKARERIFYGKRTPEHEILQTIALIAEGNDLDTLSRIIGFRKETITQWLQEAAQNIEQVNEALISEYQIDPDQLESLWESVLEQED